MADMNYNYPEPVSNLNKCLCKLETYDKKVTTEYQNRKRGNLAVMFDFIYELTMSFRTELYEFGTQWIFK